MVMKAAHTRVVTRYTKLSTPMTSRASISSEMRMAPSCAVNPAPTCAARAIPAISGVISRVLATEEMMPVNASAPICWRPLNPFEPDLGAGEEAHGEDHEEHAAADDQGARADRDVGDEVDDLLAVPPPLGHALQHPPVEAELVEQPGHGAEAAPDALLELFGERGALGPVRGVDGHRYAFWGMKLKYTAVRTKFTKNSRMKVMTTAWLTASPTPLGPPLA